MSKYQIWYDDIVGRARCRIIPKCYTELHHVKPRSLGGGDEDANLVRLTYREHFLVHWLLTKICTGGDLRRMQRALLAMAAPASGERITAGWQFDAAKRAVRDLELDPVAEAEWQQRHRQRRLIQQAESWCGEYHRHKSGPSGLIRNRTEVETAVGTEANSLKAADLSKLASVFLKGTRRMNSKRVRRYLSDASSTGKAITS